MTLAPGLRRLTLTVHLVSSLGWTGALAGFLILSVTGLYSQDPQMVRAAYVASDLITWAVIVPLALVSVLTGTIQAFGTSWGLFRHYWVVFKLLIVVAATFMLLAKTGPIGFIAGAAAEAPVSGDDFLGLRISIAGHAIGGLLVLLWAAALGVYKPRGVTRYGARKLREAPAG